MSNHGIVLARTQTIPKVKSIGLWIRRIGSYALLFSIITFTTSTQGQSRSSVPTVSPGSALQDSTSISDQSPETSAKSVSADQAAAEKVLSMLMAIDPYCPSDQVKGRLAVFGTPTMGALVNQWSTVFTRFHPEADIEISEMKGQATLQTLAKNPLGVAMMSRPLSTEEFETLKKSGLKKPIQVEVGNQALGVFVHADNPMSAINQEQFLKIFALLDEQPGDAKTAVVTDGVEEKSARAGQIVWGDLGLKDDWSIKPVHVIHREAASGTHAFLKNQLLNDRKLRQPKEVFTSSTEVLQAIAADPLAVGISNLRSPISKAKALTLHDGKSEIACSDYSILTGDYPLVRRLTLVFDGSSDEANKLAREFVKYAICQDGQRETILSGFFPLDPPLLRAQLNQIEPTE